MSTPPPPQNVELHKLTTLLTEIRARKLAIARKLDFASSLAPSLVRDIDLAHALGLHFASAHARNLPRNLASARIRARDLTLTRAHTLTRGLDRTLGLGLDLDRTLRLTDELAEAVADALARISALTGEQDKPHAGARQVVVARAAGRLAAVSTRLLPAGERPRYAEEFAVELWDLAANGAGRWQQITYARRLLLRSWGLRVELKAPHQRKATP